jgi:hypothetical protein
MKLLTVWLFGAAAFAQLAPNSVTVTASRNAVIPSDQIVFNVSIGASPQASFDDVLAAAAGAGLTTADLVGLNYSTQQPAPALAQWTFRLAAPLRDMNATVGLLTGLQQNFAKDKSFTLSFAVGGTQLSPSGLQQSQACPLSDLLADARTQAANLAGGGLASVGPIQSLTAMTGNCSLTARFALGAAAPSPSDSITVTATTPPSAAAPSRLAVNLVVSADLGVGLDQILQAAAGTGVTASNLIGVSQTVVGRVCITTPCNPVDWSFRYTTPFSKWKDAMTALAAAVSAKHPGITIAYSVSVDTPDTPKCAAPTLISQAQQRAADLAAAAGVGVGPLSSLSDATPVAQPQVAVAAVLSLASFVSYPPVYRAPGCTVVAQFPILH